MPQKIVRFGILSKDNATTLLLNNTKRFAVLFGMKNNPKT